MNTGVIRSMLLLDEPNITGLRQGIESYSKVFLSVVFIGALTWQFLTDMKFFEVVKNLVLALIFMGCFYEFHTKAVDLSFKASEELLREVSPKNIFLRKWTEVKVKTSDNVNDSSKFSFIEKFVVPNLNDLLGTALFLLSKVCILVLKLIYTTVYYFTFIFAPITAVLSFLPVSKHSMAGTITSSLWCILLPFVLVVFLALVGNAVQMPADNGQLAVSSMDQLIWIFGITLLMLLAPSFTYSLIKGSVANTADAVGVKMTGVGAQALVSLPIVYGLGQKFFGKGKKAKDARKGNYWKQQNAKPYSRNFFQSGNGGQNISKNVKQSSYQEKGGENLKQATNSAVKLSQLKTTNQTQQVNTKTMLVNTKIPHGSSVNPNSNVGIKQAIKLNPDVSSKKLVTPLSGNRPQVLSSKQQIYKEVHPTKVAVARSFTPQLQRKPIVKDFKTVIPKERQREV